jgi:hypothetical protein
LLHWRNFEKEDLPMKTIVALLLPLALAGCVTAEAQAPMPVTEQEEQATDFAWFRCLQNAVRKMDDGVSDASTIAMAVAPMCSREFAAVVEVYERKRPPSNPAVRRMFEQGVQRQNQNKALQFVLEHRTSRR